jgi:hypothetical protein
MLNHAKVASLLKTLSEELFIDLSHEHEVAYKVWQKISKDPTFLYRVRQISTPWPVPTWYQQLSDKHKIAPLLKDYKTTGIDGSQIYPERHRGTMCYLINIGIASFNYKKNSKVVFNTQPHVFSGYEHYDDVTAMDVVNAKRLELELSASINTINNENDNLSIILFDGSLIFWHLPNNQKFKREYLLSYFSTLDRLYQKKQLCASYISMPRSKELINLIKLSLSDFDIAQKELYSVVDHIADESIMARFLPVGYRSTVFCNNSSVSDEYPAHLRPHFFYLNVGNEVGRVEIPAWIAQDNDYIESVSKIIFDQCIKGSGYPIALAESHEQAVVKGADRDFFYYLLEKQQQKIGQRSSLHAMSQKSIKKRRLGI